MRTIFKGALAAAVLTALPAVGVAPAQAADIGIGVSVGDVHGYYDTGHRWHRCDPYDRWCGYHREYYRPYYHVRYVHDWCWYHPYDWNCRY